MSSNPDSAHGPTAGSQMTVNSPDKQTPQEPAPPRITQIAQKTERPSEPHNPFLPYARIEDETPIGNPKAIALLKHEGQLGIFYDRNRTTRVPTPINVEMTRIRDSAFRTLEAVLKDKIRSQRQLDTESIETVVYDVARDLANGVSVMLYMKLRVVNYHDQRISDRYRTRPKVPQPFQVPQPYALAISQLGQIKLSGMEDEKYFTPTVPAAIDVTYGCYDDRPWNTASYARAVDFAQNLGMRFASVDLDVKMGSSWWLFRPACADDGSNFRLECPFPEENFTENSAILAMLFANPDEDGRFDNAIIDLEPLGADTYGTMFRNPFTNIHINVFDAVVEEKAISFRVGT